MTRPKVEDDKRQRTAQACDSCKRRKQKCNGARPCNTCGRRSLTCTYLTTHHGVRGDSAGSDLKRRRTESEVGEGNGSSPSVKDEQYYTAVGAPPRSHAPGASRLMPPGSDKLSNARRSPRALSSDGEDEAENHTMTRMLVDPTGRLCQFCPLFKPSLDTAFMLGNDDGKSTKLVYLYVGDTATLSFLQLIRMMVESTVGPSTFTVDPGRHRLTENTLGTRPKQQMTHLLPDKQTTRLLVNSFFVNTNLVQVFNEREFHETLDKCYSSPLFVDPSWLCLLNLVLAIGLVLATPESGSPEAVLVENLRGAYKCDIFFFNAKHLNDPIIGFEDADFWSVQALLLMATFMLCRSKRNAAFAYIGMAARSAYSLGLHREETLVIFPPAEQFTRRQVWRSLYILDRFLAISLGRPPAIHEDDCSGNALDPPPTTPNPTHSDIQFYHSGLEAGVRGSNILSVIIKEIYQKRKVSTRTAQEIADRCKLWPKTLPSELHWRRASPSNPRQAILILHVNMLYCHAIILFTRPFFLYLLSSEMRRKYLGSNQYPQPRHGKMEKFSEACVIAALHTIALIQNAYNGGYLPKQNPWVIYCLLSAALVVISGKFAPRSTHEASNQSTENAVSILSYCGKADPQAARMVSVLNSFREVVSRQDQSSQPSMSGKLQLPSATPGSFSQTNSSVRQTKDQPHGLPQAPVPLHRGDANPSVTGPATVPFFKNTSDPTISAPPFTPSSLAAPNLASTPTPISTAAGLQLPPRLPYIHTDSFSGLLDLENAEHPLGSSEESSGPENEIDFDALWPWPGNEMGTPDGVGGGMMTPGGSLNLKDLGVQGISDSPVPLFGTMKEGS